MQGYNAHCIHGLPIFDTDGNLVRCPKCRATALAAINPEALNEFMTAKEQKAYGLTKYDAEHDTTGNRV